MITQGHRFDCRRDVTERAGSLGPRFLPPLRRHFQRIDGLAPEPAGQLGGMIASGAGGRRMRLCPPAPSVPLAYRRLSRNGLGARPSGTVRHPDNSRPMRTRTRTAAGMKTAAAVSVAVSLAAIPASGEQAQTTHHSPLPRVTAGGQADWPLHNLDIKGSRYSSLRRDQHDQRRQAGAGVVVRTGRGPRHCPGDATGRRRRHVSQRRLDAVRGKRRQR